MSAEGLDALRARVHDGRDLERRLYETPVERFGAEVVCVAAELGCEVTEADVEAAIAQAKRAWTLRWIR